jgi:radical SAM protein with 4Fe4S-binding SPASM domain
MFSLDSYPQKSDELVWRVIKGKVVILTLDGREIYTLNKVGSTIWELADGSRDLKELVSLIHERFDVSFETIHAEVFEFVKQLVDKNILQITNAETETVGSGDMVKHSTNLGEKLIETCTRENIPYAVLIELTSKCNLNCRHCFMVNDNGIELSSDEVMDIIDQLVDMGTFSLTFTGGEIFTREDLFEIARYAKRKGFFLTFMTNGTLITAEKMEEIKKLKTIMFDISLYGATPKTHDGITRVKGSFDRTITAINELVEHGIDVTVKTVLMNLNIHESCDINALCEQLGVHHWMDPGIAPKKNGSLEPLQYDLSFEDMETYLSAEDFDLSYLSEKQEKDPVYRFNCKAGKATCSISPSGIVYPCVMMPLAVGNIREKSFKEIWHTKPSYELERLRNLTSYHLPTCSKCDLASFCIRCPGVVYLETGDIVGASQSACRYAKWRKYSKNQKVVMVTPSTGSKTVF